MKRQNLRPITSSKTDIKAYSRAPNQSDPRRKLRKLDLIFGQLLFGELVVRQRSLPSGEETKHRNLRPITISKTDIEAYSRAPNRSDPRRKIRKLDLLLGQLPLGEPVVQQRSFPSGEKTNLPKGG